MLPFTREQFVAVFAAYNGAVWPAQIVAGLLGLAMVVALLRPSQGSDRILAAGLAAMWMWTGIAYHWVFFAAINAAAPVFGALFALQGALFLALPAMRVRMSFGRAGGPLAWLGWAFVAYAAVAYPLLGLWLGHTFAEMPMFGITPCPVTIATFGWLLLAAGPVPRWLLVIPLIWSVIGGSAAFLLGIPQDWLLLISGVAVPCIVHRDRGRTGKSSTDRY